MKKTITIKLPKSCKNKLMLESEVQSYICWGLLGWEFIEGWNNEI